MQIQTSGKNIDIGTAFQTHVEERLTDGINKYFNGATSAHVFVEKQRAQFITEIVVHLPTGLVLQAQGNGGDAYSSFEEALEHIEKRLRRYKRRLVSHARQREKPLATMPAQSFVIAPPAEEEEAEEAAEAGGEEEFVPAIVAETTEQVPEMTVGEAVLQLELADREVLLFRNARHGGVNVVYRRRDGHIGWVDPGPCPQEGQA
jgi:ribosomal subunit interface protein